MTNCRSFHRCVLVMTISMITLPSFGAPQPEAPTNTPIRPQAIAIQWQDGSRTHDNDRQGCENLGTSLLIGADPWQHGIFTSQACFFGDEAPDSSSPMRFGPSLTKGGPLLEQSALVSVFTEIRAGPAQGLRWYWDFAPESRAVTGTTRILEGIHYSLFYVGTGLTLTW